MYIFYLNISTVYKLMGFIGTLPYMHVICFDHIYPITLSYPLLFMYSSPLSPPASLIGPLLNACAIFLIKKLFS